MTGRAPKDRGGRRPKRREAAGARPEWSGWYWIVPPLVAIVLSLPRLGAGYFWDDYVFMNNESYEQMHVAPVALGDAADYMVEGMTAQVAFFQGEIISVEIPASVELTIAQTEPGVQGDRVSGARKPAKLETGKVVQVPLFVEVGDRIKVDTRSGEYITRV